MQGGKRVSEQGRLLSFTISMMLILSPLLIGISVQLPSASAGAVDHDVGNLGLISLTDYGRILKALEWNAIPQTTEDPLQVGFIGLVIDQDNYNHSAGSEQVADPFGTFPYINTDDFDIVNDITWVINNVTTQKSVCSFENTAAGTGDPNDILIEQTAWTVLNKDWAILQWRLINQKAVPLTDVCIGLELPLSQVGALYGVGWDSGDDIDGFDAENKTYWVQDDGGTTIGFASAISPDPITHYYSQDYHAEYENASNPLDPDSKYYKNFFADDSWLYNRLHAPNAVEGSTPGNRSSTVGWNGINIGVGSSRTFTLVIAINNSYDNMITSLENARYYYENLATRFILTEFSDSGGSQQIEVYNDGREPTPGSAIEFSVDGGSTFLTGSWDKDPIPTYEYAVFDITGGTIGTEGDTISMYENGKFIEEVAFGQEGVAPDPLPSPLESVARRYDTSNDSYTNEWLRNASSGSTFGSQNDVGIIIFIPIIVINRVIFNPINTLESYVELMYKSLSDVGVNIEGYKIVCNDAFIVPSIPNLNLTNRFFVLTYSDFPVFFTNMNAGGDNVYLYDNNDNLLDMVGWSSSHIQGYYMSRIPDGNGTYQGFNDITSQAAGWVFDQLPSLMITEFYADPSNTDVELYNPRGGDKVLDGRWTIQTSTGGTITPSWSLGTIPANGGYDYCTSPGPAGNEGDTISLYYNLGSGNILMDEVSYGTFGMAPDPLSGESTARYWNSSSYQYHDEWNRDPTETFGAQNDVPALNLSSYLILTEVMFNPIIDPDGKYVILTNREPSWIWDAQNYILVTDSAYQIPFSAPLGVGDRLIIRYGDDAPASDSFFATMDATGDNVYLYDPNGRLCDMVGWTSAHNQGMSVRRIPSTNGTQDGYDDTSSVTAGWVFNYSPTPPPPSPPRGLHAKLVSSAKDVMLSWNASADDGKGENDVVGYSVYKSITGVNGSYVFEVWIPANGSLSYNWTDINAGDGDWNDYFYIVRTNDTLNNEEQNENKAGKFVNYLVVDWNLFSVPLIQINTSMEYVLQTIEGNYITIQGYHAGKSRPWLHWHKPKPHYFNDVIEINHKNGYYINMLNPDYLIVAGKVPTNTQIPLKTGWNLIGYPCLINKTVNDALSSIAGKYNIVEYYDTVKDREVRLGPNDYMKPGLGYWVHAIEDCILIM